MSTDHVLIGANGVWFMSPYFSIAGLVRVGPVCKIGTTLQEEPFFISVKNYPSLGGINYQ